MVAVTKTFGVPIVRMARSAGIEHLGENRAADLASKATAVPATWHYLGKVQTGTAGRVADHADVIHSAEPGRALERVGRRAAEAGRAIDCLAQVDFTSGRHQGVPPQEVEAFLERARELAGIRLIGLMTLPPQTPSAEEARPFFAKLRDLRGDLQDRWPEVRELSMGMSGDYEIAVEEGATMVRVGTALFGERLSLRPGAV
jgi:PLP dependent protein